MAPLAVVLFLALVTGMFPVIADVLTTCSLAAPVFFLVLFFPCELRQSCSLPCSGG